MSMFGAVDLSSLTPAPASAAPAGAPKAGTAEQDALPAPLVVDVDATSLRDVAEVSTQVPVVVVVHSARSQASVELAAMLERLTREHAGAFELARVDADAAPEVAQALQVQAVPTVLALLAGQPVPIFQGMIAEDELRGVLDQLLQLAARNGVTGRIRVDGEPVDASEEETEVESEARRAIERGDWAGAEAVYDKAITLSPGDSQLVVARDQVRLMHRLDGQDPQALLAAAQADPADLDAALAAADAALALGDVEGALDRVLEAVRTHTGAERDRARLRALELFGVIGAGTPEVARARRRLSTLLF
ncbi:MAG: tetratricopeptide repeat protein [Actinomyces sp.]|uniref:tetratricopeptide repeat protein n=1 Tax=Actinomyces sp. TaxID=29317 RepID=UPI0026DB2091|nr:tetratricopeptide repeat protein [Actinomyces sp.]MDO4243668.1 tetratricopeptide repeat protein [Actinomyces sp.]